jgi:hypothetical protein
LAALDRTATDKGTTAPIDEAMRVRAACLKALTLVRRALGASTRTGGADALLDELSRERLGKPQRDDRGVVVTLRELFDGDRLSEAGRDAVTALSRVGARHPTVPLLVVLHQRGGLDAGTRKRWEARGVQLVAALRKELGERVAAVELAGDAVPVVDPNGSYAARNERVDIVFVTRQAL